LAYGLVPASEQDEVVAALLELMSPDPAAPSVEIYGMFWVLEALGRTGHISEALALIGSYYGRLLNAGATTWWEVFDADQRYTNALSHGWGGSPTWFLTTYVLGARRSGPASWVVAPSCLSSLNHVSGSLPLGAGDLLVSWSRQGFADATVELNAPAGTAGEFVIPFCDPTTVLTVNGEVVWQNQAPLLANVAALSDGIHVPLTDGAYTITVHQDRYMTFVPAVTP
jgi:alpha-L-rhamnosidase